jgi:monooxygenase
MSESVKTYDRSLGDPVYTTSCEHSRQEREDAMNAQHFDVLIIGAGLSGIGQACQVRAALPNKSIAILERRERLGGTWDLFRYPGVRSDSDMYTFGYKFRPWQDVQVLADGPSIREYIAETAAEFGIDDKIHFGLKVVNADWSSAQSRWTVTTLHEASGETRTYTCGFLISCTGYYNFDAGYLPTFPGVDQFKGRCVHPQHWPEDLDYAGKKVVVIGSGATAVTLVPAMAGDAEQVTMLQRSPSYIVSVPGLDKISEILGRLLPAKWVWKLARKRQIAFQRYLYLSCRRWPAQMRRLLLWQVRRYLGPAFDMSHFTPKYMPWDERLCLVPNGDLFKVLKSGDASVITDQIDTFTEKGILLKSGRELEADIIITATGINLQLLGGMQLSVDGDAREMRGQMTYKGVLVENIPNLAWIIGYTNASWTLKADIAGAYLCRLFKHMDDNGHAVATPRDVEDCALDVGMFDQLQSGYVKRGNDALPRQGSKHPWKVLMHYGQDSKMLLEDPVDDGLLRFDSTAVGAAVA